MTRSTIAACWCCDARTRRTKGAPPRWCGATDGAGILRGRGSVVTGKLDSGVPPHVRSTAHVRHALSVRHGGSGRGRDDAELWRYAHLRLFLSRSRIGSRTTPMSRSSAPGRWAGAWPAASHPYGEAQPRPTIVVVHSIWLTTRELAIRSRQRLGERPPRPAVGAWSSGDVPRTPAGAIRAPVGLSRRLHARPPIKRRPPAGAA